MAEITSESMKPHQRATLGLCWKTVLEGKYGLVYGGKGTFKTSTITITLWHLLRYLSRYYVGLRYVVPAMTLTQAKEAFLEAWQKHVPASEYHYHKGEHIISLNGTTDATGDIQTATQIKLTHTSAAKTGKAAERASRAKRGGNINGFYFPQAESVSLTYYDEIDSRVRDTPKRRMDPATGKPFDVYPPFEVKLLDANPDSPEHWLYKRFLDPTSDSYVGEMVLTQKIKTTAEGSAYPQWKLDKWRKEWPEHTVARMLDAEWVGAAGRVYTGYDTEVHAKKFKPNPDWDWYMAIDFGYNAPFCCLWIGVDKDGRLHIFDEIYQRETRIDILAKKMFERHPDLKVKAAIVDSEEPNAYLTIQKVYRDMGGHLPTILANKAVSDGIQLVSKWLSTDKEGNPHVIFHRHNTPNLQHEILTWEWEPRDEGDMRRIKETPQENGQDHALDAFRYFIMYIDPLLARKGIRI